MSDRSRYKLESYTHHCRGCDDLQAEVERLRDALKQNAIWTEEDNTKALSDPKFATMLWRGCVATASEALNKAERQLQKDSNCEQVESKCNEEASDES